MAAKQNCTMSSNHALTLSSPHLDGASASSDQFPKISAHDYAKKTKDILVALNCVSNFDGKSISLEFFIYQVRSLYNTVAMDEDIFVQLLIVNRLKGRAFEAFDSGFVITTLDGFVNTLRHALRSSSYVNYWGQKLPY